MKHWSSFVFAAALAAIVGSTQAADKPIKALLITGGCCHDYKAQKDILKAGLEKRLNVEVDVIWASKTEVKNGVTNIVNDGTTKPALPIYGNAEYAKGYDLVIHDECAADIKDPAVIAGVLAPHKAGTPGVNLHCAMHCYRFGDFKSPVKAGADNAGWFEYTGLQTTVHGAQLPIAISFVDQAHAANAGLSDWTTGNEELYNNIQVMPTSHVLARGKQTTKNKEGKENTQDNVVTWVNSYGDKKTRVWSTTVGHNNATVEDARYLDMVANGIVWALNRENLRK